MPVYAGTQLPFPEIYKLALAAGFPTTAGPQGSPAVIITAIAMAESGGWTGAIGDEKLAGERTDDGRTWGESFGLTQVRSIREERGTGRARDASILTDGAANLRSAFTIWKEAGRSFRPWSTFTDGAWRKHLPGAARAAQTSAPPPAAGTPAAPAGAADTPNAYGGLDRGEHANLADPIAALSIDGFTDVASQLVSAPVDLSVSQISQITLTLSDPGLQLAKALSLRTEVISFGTWRFRIAALEANPGVDGRGRLIITARSAVAQALKHPPYVGPYAMNDTSPSEALAKVARNITAQPSPRRAQLVVNGPNGGPDAASGKNDPQTWWDAAQKWASEEGFWLFESGGKLYFGKPSWLVATMPHFEIVWRGRPDGSLLEMPTFRASEDSDATITVTLRVRWQLGVQVHPGMAVWIRNVGTLSGAYIVTQVSGNLGSVDPWTVTAVVVKDPVATVAESSGSGTSLEGLGIDMSEMDADDVFANGLAGLGLAEPTVDMTGIGWVPASGLTGASPTWSPPDAVTPSSDADQEDPGPPTAKTAGTPAARGWGHPGEPGSEQGTRYRRDHIDNLVIYGRTLPLRREVIPIFRDLVIQLNALGYDIGEGLDDWGYAHRYIAGTRTLSNHAWGLAIDYNATKNPQSRKLITEFDVAKIHRLLQRYGGLIRWGGDYVNAKKDAMHFEWMGSRDQALQLIARMGL